MQETTAPFERFMAKIEKVPSGCWEWRAAVVAGKPGESGYGQFWFDGKVHRAHRWIYSQVVGELVDGMQLDHLCRNTVCVRPDHLEQVTPRVNTLRSTAPAAVNAKRTHCIHGHEFTADNTIVTTAGKRRCRACRTANAAGWNERRRLARKTSAAGPAGTCSGEPLGA